jgi:hypothetical protein
VDTDLFQDIVCKGCVDVKSFPEEVPQGVAAAASGAIHILDFESRFIALNLR